MEIPKVLKSRSFICPEIQFNLQFQIHEQTTHSEAYCQERDIADELIFLESHMATIYMLASSPPDGIGKPLSLF